MTNIIFEDERTLRRLKVALQPSLLRINPELIKSMNSSHKAEAIRLIRMTRDHLDDVIVASVEEGRKESTFLEGERQR